MIESRKDPLIPSQFVVAIIGVTVGFDHTHLDADGLPIANNISAVNAQIAFIAIFIFFFASTWGPGYVHHVLKQDRC